MNRLTALVRRLLAGPQQQETPAPAIEMPVAADGPETQALQRIAVIGAGVMGAGIAARFASAGFEVDLLDKMPGAAEKAVKRMKSAAPTDAMNAAFLHPSHASRIRTGTTDEHMSRIAEADWIVEAVPEVPAIKHETFLAIQQYRKPGAIVSSNTSTIPLSVLTEGLSPEFREHFLISHFFNPVRHMQLMELVSGPETRPEVTALVRKTADHRLGKTVVEAKDTPGFIANRIGSFMIQAAIAEAVDNHRSIEEIDAALGKALGFPKEGVFGLMDIVGLDVAGKVADSFFTSLPPEDEFHTLKRPLPALQSLIDNKRTGRKSPTAEGFYRLKTGADGKKQKEVIDLESGEYRPVRNVRFESFKAGKKGLGQLLDHGDAGSQIAWNVLSKTLIYAANLLPELGGDMNAIDTAMRTGYNWKRGPFEMIDAMGEFYFSLRMSKEERPVPAIMGVAGRRSLYDDRAEARHQLTLTDGQAYTAIRQPEGMLSLDDVRRKGPPVEQNGSASLWDIGDGVLCAELHGMKETLDAGSLDMLNTALDTVRDSQGRYKALVVHSDSANFAAGANLVMALMAMNLGKWDDIDELVHKGQQTYQRIKFAPFPVVAAVHGKALGGGCELGLHCSARQLSAESYPGLVETAVGFIPGWGGCKEMLLRMEDAHGHHGPMFFITEAFKHIMRPDLSVASSAYVAKDKLFLREGDGISMNPARLLADAKARALDMADKGYTPPQPRSLRLPGAGGRASLDMAMTNMYESGHATWFDVQIASALTDVLTGGNNSGSVVLKEDEILQLERQSFMRLAQTLQTSSRIAHMLKTGKPLREVPLVLPASATEIRTGLPDSLAAERSLTLLWPAVTAPSPTAAVEASIDTTGMKPLQAMLHILKKDGWLPETTETHDGLRGAFNTSARKTKDGLRQKLEANATAASFAPGKVVRKGMLDQLDGSIQRNEQKLSEAANDPFRSAELKAAITVLRHYRGVAEKLTV